MLSRILLVAERPSVSTGLRLLEDCLKVNSQDPLILSIILSCISSLFVFLSMSSCQITTGNCVALTGVTLLPLVLQKIFSAVVFTENGDIKITRSESIKALRRHAVSLMVKIAHKYPLLLLPIFDEINVTVQNFYRTPGQLSYMEQITLQEALFLISNHFCDYERQSNFIAESIRDGVRQWILLLPLLNSSSNFIEFVGLNKQPNENVINDPHFLNRGLILFSLNTVLGVIKRCSWPDDPDRASRGGFVVGLTESGNPICRNPATPHVVPLLPHVLSLLRVLNELWKPNTINLISPGYKKANFMLESEKKTLLGTVPMKFVDPLEVVHKHFTAFDRMQQFLSLIYENCYHMMGSVGPSLGRDLYSLPGIADAIIGSIFNSLENVPDFRLRPIVRCFLKPFSYSCPPIFYDTVLLPLYSHFGPFSK